MVPVFSLNHLPILMKITEMLRSWKSLLSVLGVKELETRVQGLSRRKVLIYTWVLHLTLMKDYTPGMSGFLWRVAFTKAEVLLWSSSLPDGLDLDHNCLPECSFKRLKLALQPFRWNSCLLITNWQLEWKWDYTIKTPWKDKWKTDIDPQEIQTLKSMNEGFEITVCPTSSSYCCYLEYGS